MEDFDFPEAKGLRRSAIVDGVLRVIAYSSSASAIVAPNIVMALDKPLAKLDATLDARKRTREVMRAIYYMKSRGYLAGDYEHGLELTAKAKRRLRRIDLENAAIVPSKRWDHVWRIVIYDIPEVRAGARQMVASYLRNIGCFQLQKSTWITPFECREAIEAIAMHAECEEYITYFEASYIANERVLIQRFAKKYPATIFDNS